MAAAIPSNGIILTQLEFTKIVQKDKLKSKIGALQVSKKPQKPDDHGALQTVVCKPFGPWSLVCSLARVFAVLRACLLICLRVCLLVCFLSWLFACLLASSCARSFDCGLFVLFGGAHKQRGITVQSLCSWPWLRPFA